MDFCCYFTAQKHTVSRDERFAFLTSISPQAAPAYKDTVTQHDAQLFTI